MSFNFTIFLPGFHDNFPDLFYRSPPKEPAGASAPPALPKKTFDEPKGFNLKKPKSRPEYDDSLSSLSIESEDDGNLLSQVRSFVDLFCLFCGLALSSFYKLKFRFTFLAGNFILKLKEENYVRSNWEFFYFYN